MPIQQKAKETFALLDSYAAVLGTTKRTFLPILTGGSVATNPNMIPYGLTGVGRTFVTSNAAGALAADQFMPHQHTGGVHSLRLVAGGDFHLLAGADDAEHSFEGDDAFSAGIWILMQEAVGTQRSLVSKYRTDATVAREYDFRFDTSGQLELELFDESTDGTEIATGGTAIVPLIWNLVVATYDGGQAAPVIHLYINDVDSNSGGGSTESGSYAEMEDLTNPMMFGARNITTAPAQEFEGRIALPFIAGSELSSADISQLFALGNRLLGL